MLRFLSDEAYYADGLAIKHHAGKWSKAKDMVRRNLVSYAPTSKAGIEFWLAVRQCYLELGGQYVSEITSVLLLLFLIPSCIKAQVPLLMDPNQWVVETCPGTAKPTATGDGGIQFAWPAPPGCVGALSFSFKH